MCSIGEDDFGDEGGLHAMIPDVNPTRGRNIIEDTNFQCSKCKKPAGIYKLPFRQAECRECFLLYTRHKFRSALGSSKVLPKDAQVVLVFDGSAESMVLLDMLHHAQTQDTFKRLHCTATVVYIDDFQLLEQNCAADDVRYERFLDDMKIFLEKYNIFDSFIVPMVNVKDVLKCISNICSIQGHKYHLQHKDEKQALLNSIVSIKSLTSRQDFVKYYRSKLLAAIAKHFKSKFVFMSKISSDLACDLLAAVALGRGGSVALDVALTDSRLGNDVKLIRPLKDLNTTEINLYLKAQDLRPLQMKRFGHEAGSAASLQNLTKSFVGNLQHDFSATVSTIFRTGDKIAVNQDVAADLDELNLSYSEKLQINDKCCLFCKSFLDYKDSTTLLAVEFSRLVSESGSALPNLNERAKENLHCSIEKPYLKKLCHACRNIYMDTSKESILNNEDC